TCGGTKLCATLVWLDHPIDPATGRPKTDRLNPDPAKRSRPLIGLQVVNRSRRAVPIPGQVESTTPTTAALTKPISRSRATASPKCKAAFLPCSARPTRGHGRIECANSRECGDFQTCNEHDVLPLP